MEIVIYIYDGMTMLDAIGPYEVLRNIENANIKFVAKKKGRITADSGFVQLYASHSIHKVDQADIILIPGSTIAFIKEMKDQKVLDWIKKIDQQSKHTVSVCTGSIILAATGLLEDKLATSHWKPIDMLKDFGAKPIRKRVVTEGKYMTAAGVSAGIDMALELVAKINGEQAAKAAQLSIEYDPEPPFNSGSYLKADKEVIELSEKQMEDDARKNISLWDKLKHFKTLNKLRNT